MFLIKRIFDFLFCQGLMFYSPQGGSTFVPNSQPSNALYQNTGSTSNNAMAGMNYGQGRATNTIDLRNKYNEYAIGMQETGQQPMSFEEWSASNFPDQKILNQ